MTRAIEHTSEAGLSLVEIMVALFIVGLSASFVMVSLPQSRSDLVRAGDAISRQVETLRETALSSGEPYGLRFTKTGVEALVYRAGDWVEPPRSLSLQKLVFADKLSVEKSGTPAKKTRDFNDKAEASEDVAPDIWFDPSGIASGDGFTLIEGADSIRFELQENGEFGVSDGR